MEAIAAQRGDAATQALAENSVSIQPASFLNKDATLGRTAAITFNPSPEQRAAGIFATQTVAFWQGAKKESQAMTVDIGCVLPPVQIATSPRFAIAIAARTYAILQYGADGNTQNAITIDVGLGKRVTVVGNYISVVVGMDQGVQGKTGHLDEEVGVVTLGASIGTFAAHTQAPITRSLYFDNLPVNTFSDHVPLPLRAAFVLPPLGASTTDTITYSFEDFNQRTIGEFAYTLSPIGPFMTSYPVPSGAYFVRIKSLQGIPTNALNQAVIPFQLSL
jgi:hypothetical protein